MQAKSPSMLVAVLVTSAVALLDAWTGDRASLLGLLIAGPLLAAANRGQLQATEPPDGRGARFELRLPLAPPAPGRPPQQRDRRRP